MSDGFDKCDENSLKKEYIPYCPFGSYAWVIIEYDGHHGFACNWEDCLEEMMFIEGYIHKDSYIEYSDPKLTHWEPIMCRNR